MLSSSELLPAYVIMYLWTESLLQLSLVNWFQDLHLIFWLCLGCPKLVGLAFTYSLMVSQLQLRSVLYIISYSCDWALIVNTKMRSKFNTYSTINYQAYSLLKSFIVHCVRVEIFMTKSFLICPYFSEIKGLSWKISKSFIADFLQIRISNRYHCVFFNLLVDSFAFDVVNTHTKEVSLWVNCKKRSRNVLFFC